MMAMFPGTPYLDQHKGQNNPPFFNQDAILPFDMTKGANTKATGLTYTDSSNSVHANIPSPIVTDSHTLVQGTVTVVVKKMQLHTSYSDRDRHSLTTLLLPNLKVLT